MTGALARRGAGRDRGSAALVAVRERRFAAGLCAPGRRCRRGRGVGGFWALAADDALGAAFTSAFEPRLGVDGLSGFFLGTLGLIAAPALVFSLRYLRADGRGRVGRACSRRRSCSRSPLVLCARDPLTLPRRLGADDAAAGGGDPRRARRRRAARARRCSPTSRSRTSAAPACGSRSCCSPRRARSATRRRSTPARGSRSRSPLAALVGMGTKAGVMPLHVWLPRAHPIAPAPVSALMSGVMIKVALYGLVRVLVEWVGVLPVWFGVLVLGARRALGGRRRRLRALPARPQAAARAALDRERRDHRARARRVPGPARARRRRVGRVRARRGAAAHAQPRGLQGAALPRRGRVRAGGRLARARPARRAPAPDAVDGRRVPRRRDGDRRAAAAERLRLGVADAAGAAARPAVRRRRRRHGRRDRARRRSRRRPRWRSSASSRSSGSCCSGRRATDGRRCGRGGAARDARGRRRPRARVRRARRSRPGCSSARSSGSRRGRPASPTRAGLDASRDGLAADGRDRASRSSRSTACARPRCAGSRSAAPAPTWACGQLVEPALRWTSAGFTKPLRLVLEAVLRPQREIAVRERGRRRAGGLATAATCRT